MTIFFSSEVVHGKSGEHECKSSNWLTVWKIFEHATPVDWTAFQIVWSRARCRLLDLVHL